MTELALDALGLAGIPPAEIKAAGYSAALGYLRNLTRGTVDALLAAGVDVGTIFETGAQESTLGAGAGSSDGATARAEAEALGQPAGSILWVNLGDFANTPAEVPAIFAYYRAFRAQTGAYTVGGYASAYLMQALAGLGAPGPWWQNGITDNGIPGSIVSAMASLYQRTLPTLQIPGHAGSYDEDVILKPVPWWSSAPTGGGKAMLPCAVVSDSDEGGQGYVIWPDRTLTPITTEAAGAAWLAMCGQSNWETMPGADIANIGKPVSPAAAVPTTPAAPPA